ncbi:MAG TPA: hypothetical protein VH600_18415, partial [Burkholderiales bacterium]
MPRTVIVLGAGASKEVGLPTGEELKQRIADLLNIRFDVNRLKSGDAEIVEAVGIHIHPGRDVNPYLQVGRHIAAAMPQAISIDNFIDAHKGDSKIEILGKLAIVRAILHAERHSTLFHDTTRSDPFQHSRIAGSWFNSFFQLLTENCREADLEQRLATVTLIVFNYDRCIEQYLYHALQTYYRMSAERAGSLVKKMRIFHPYGSVGGLPWYGGTNTSDFGYDPPRASDLLKLAKGIKTFTEGTDPSSSDIADIRARVIAAERLVFLGFAFHPLNLELLWDKERQPGIAIIKCFATGKGISQSDVQAITADLVRFANPA